MFNTSRDGYGPWDIAGYFGVSKILWYFYVGMDQYLLIPFLGG
jgi:hypothetical protein